jgi:hypothetical protein
MKKFFKKAANVLTMGVLFAIVFAPPALAAGEPTFVAGAQKLLNDVTNWLLALIPASAGAAIGYHALMKQLSDGDPASAAVHNRAMRNVLVAGAIGMSAVSIVKVFLSYF